MKPLVAFVLASLLTVAVAQAGLVEIENQFRAVYEENVGAKFAAAVAELDTKYVGALERARQQATQADRLEEAVAFESGDAAGQGQGSTSGQGRRR